MAVTIQERRLTPEEYIEFLKRTDLGSQYPRERFEERIPRLLEKTSLSLAAVDETGKIVGMLMGLTDFAYWLFVTDLGVDRGCVRQGIGAQLMRKAHAPWVSTISFRENRPKSVCGMNSKQKIPASISAMDASMEFRKIARVRPYSPRP